jgi:hypothetical protein
VCGGRPGKPTTSHWDPSDSPSCRRKRDASALKVIHTRVHPAMSLADAGLSDPAAHGAVPADHRPAYGGAAPLPLQWA